METMTSPVGVVSYPHIIKEDPRYGGRSCKLIFDLSDIAVQKWFADLREAAKAALTAKKIKHDGAQLPWKKDNDGHLTVSFRSKFKVVAVDRSKDVIDDEDDIYGGCYGRVRYKVYGYKTSNTLQGVGLGLAAFQKIRDGEPLGSNAAEGFDEVEEEDAADPLSNLPF